MSQLDQAKKEAKRLFNLAKANNPENNLVIENLSKSREILSLVNGYKDWHEYEEVLKRKDFIFDKIDKNTTNKINKEIYNNQKYYIQDITFNNISSQIVNNNIVINKEHKNIILGHIKEKTFFETKEKKWILNNYPVLIQSSTGAGKTEVLSSLSSQYMENGEGVIYCDGKGDIQLYQKFFSYAQKYNRLDDLYCLNFMTDSKDIFNENGNEEKSSHSIDPINPMLGDNDYFQTFFGRIGVVIHAILKNIHKKSQIMDIQSLESILMLNNLINWSKNNKFETEEINNYLQEIGLSLSEDNDENDFNEALLNHSINCHKAYELISLIKSYSHVFKIDCSINMEKIFLERKILIVLFPMLIKSEDQTKSLTSLVISQIKYIEEKYQKYNIHLQNIILDEFNFFTEAIQKIQLASTKNNYIFSCSCIMCNDNNNINYVLMNVKTNIIMKYSDNKLNNNLKLELINNLESLPELIFKSLKNKNNSFMKNFISTLQNLKEGQAYILSKNDVDINDSEIINNEKKYYCEYLNCIYLPIKYEKKSYLINQLRPTIYINK